MKNERNLKFQIQPQPQPQLQTMNNEFLNNGKQKNFEFEKKIKGEKKRR